MGYNLSVESFRISHEKKMQKSMHILILSYTVQIYIVGRGGQHDTLANNMININMIAINMVYTEHAILV